MVCLVSPSFDLFFYRTDLCKGVTVNNSPVSVATGSSALSAIDTGTTLIGGPTNDVAKIWAAVPGAVISTSNAGFYTFR